MDSHAFITECRRRYAMAGFGDLTAAELRSWRNSWPPLVHALMRAGLGDFWLYLEFGTPGGGSRFDALLLGSTGHTALTAVVVELKQWTGGTLVPAHEVDVPGLGIVTHPISQVRSYVGFLRHWFQHERMDLDSRGVALLHAANDEQVGALRRRNREGDVEEDRFLLGNSDIAADVAPAALVTAFRCGDLKEPSEEQVGEFEAAHWFPDDLLLDQVGDLLDGAQGAALIGDQQDTLVKLLRIVDEARADTSRQTVVMVSGGPGSGKTLIAVKLLARLFRSRIRARYLTPSGSLLYQLQEAANVKEQDDDEARAKKELFVPPEKTLKHVGVAILDEAQRLSRHGGGFARLLRANYREVPVVVVFLDERQIIRPTEGVTEDEVRYAAHEAGAELRSFTLSGCFRCNGSRAYGQWVDAVLYEEPVVWGGEGYDVAAVQDPDQLESWIAGHAHSGRRARISAGFCWDWDRDGRSLEPEVVIRWTDAATGVERIWGKPWNSYRIRRDRDRMIIAPESRKWATDPGGDGQIGCIYTAQGLEYDAAGVIIGTDLVRRKGRWVAQPDESSDVAVNRLSPDEYLPLALNIYRVLLTRGTKACRIFSVDQETQQFLTSLLPQQC